MNVVKIMIASIIFFIFGTIFFAYQQQWIIFIFPQYTQKIDPTNLHQSVQRKNITLHFWKNKKWNHEQSTIIWSADQAQNIKFLCNSWFNLAEDENITDNDILLLSAIVTTNNEAFISLNKFPFNKSDSTFSKLMFIESLLKTLRTNNISIQSIRFLIHHQPFDDDHLNFDVSWPISGFLPQ